MNTLAQVPVPVWIALAALMVVALGLIFARTNGPDACEHPECSGDCTDVPEWMIDTDHAKAQRREEELAEALQPFAKAAAIRLCGGDYWTDDKPIQGTDVAFHITFGDLRRADSALSAFASAREVES